MVLTPAGAGFPATLQEWLLGGGGLAGVYGLLAAASFLKYVAPFLPGDLALMVGVFVVGVRGGSWPAAVAVITAAGTAGAFVAYLWGRRFGGVLSRWRRAAGAVAKVQALLGRWGAWALLVNRFVPYLRTLFFPVAGVLRLPAGTVAFAAAGGNLLFAVLLVGLGYSAGREYNRLTELYHFYEAWLSAVAVLLLAGALLYGLWLKPLRARRAAAGEGAP